MTNIVSKDVNFTFFNQENMPADFIPFIAGQKGEQNLLKFTKENQTAFLYLGESPLIPDETQKTIIQLTQDGWKMQGKIIIYFDGKMHPDINILFEKDILLLELGSNLLTLVDPKNNAPLLETLGLLRADFAQNTGFVLPGINIKDNLKLSPNEYIFKIKNNIKAKGEIFPDRFLVLGEAEKLDKIKGWMTIDPTFKVRAKWIEESEKQTAIDKKCLIINPLNVLLTNIKETINTHMKDILGLQELRYLVERIYQTHPVIAEDFLRDNHKLRMLKIILKNLLNQNVIIKDIINILEIIGENLEQINNTDLIAEIVRMNIAPQICGQYLDKEDKLNVFCFEKTIEQKLINKFNEAGKTQKPYALTCDEIEELSNMVKDAANNYPDINVIITPPQIRLFLNKLFMNQFPHMAFISTAESLSAKANLRIIHEIKHKRKKTK